MASVTHHAQYMLLFLVLAVNSPGLKSTELHALTLLERRDMEWYMPAAFLGEIFL